MNQAYINSVRLLLAVAPAIFRRPLFALKGGTAINLFVRDMPRLSVDLDRPIAPPDRGLPLVPTGFDGKTLQFFITAPVHPFSLPTTLRVHPSVHPSAFLSASHSPKTGG